MSQRLILVIDDEVDTIDLVEAAFQRRGYEVIGAWNGHDGLAARARTMSGDYPD